MADYEVGGLIIQVQSDAEQANKELDDLTAKLSAFKSVVNSSKGLASFSRNLTALSTAVAALDLSKMSAMGSFATSLAALSGVRISANIGNQLQKINEVMMGLDEGAVSNFMMITQGLLSMGEISGFRWPRGLIEGLQKTAKFAQTIEGQDFTKLRDLVDIIRSMYDVSGETGERITALTKSVQNMSNSFRTASTRGRTFNTVLANVRTRTLMLVAALRRAVHYVTEGLSTYGDYIETLNLFSVAMDECAGSAYEFGQQAQNLLGIDITQWMKAQGVFMELGKGFGIATDRAAVMSQQLTQLGYDISSFYNIDVESAMTKVESGFAGQLRPLRALGFDLSQAKLEAIALSMGIDKEVKSMNQAEKSQLRYIAMLTQVTDVQGDLARTIDSPINQMRILQAQVQQLYRSLGLVLMPVLNELIPRLNAIVRVIKMILDEIAALFGYVLPTLSGGKDYMAGVTIGAEDLTDELEDANEAAETLKNTLASFDEINLIGSKSGSGSGSGDSSNIGSDWNFDLPTYDFLGDAAESRAKKLADEWMQDLRPAIDTVKDIIGWVRENLDDIEEILTTLAVAVIGSKLAGALLGCLATTESMANALNALVKGGAMIAIGFQISYLGGKDIAQGDIVEGILKGALGTSVAALGGYMLFGPAGLIISVVASLGFIWKGYEDEKAAQFKEYLDTIFFEIDENAQSLEDFVQDWQDFTAKITNPEVLEQANVMDEIDQDIHETIYSINMLRANYAMGSVDAHNYVMALEEEFSHLADLVDQYFGSAADTIRTGLTESLQLFLLSAGFTSEQIETMMQTAMDDLGVEVDTIVAEINRLGEQYRLNEITADEYSDALNDQIDMLKEYLNVTDLTSESVDAFNKTMQGINFSDFDSVLGAITQISETFGTTMDDLHTERDAMLEAMERMGKIMPEEYKDLWQGVIDGTTAYYADQEQKLIDEYQTTMGRLEESAFNKWDKVFDLHGFEDTVNNYGEQMLVMDAAIDEAYSKHSEYVTRNASAFRDTTAEIRSYSSELTDIQKKWRGDRDEVARRVHEMIGEHENNMQKIRDAYKATTDETGTQTSKYESIQTNFFQTNRNNMLAMLNDMQGLTSGQKKELEAQVRQYGSYSNNVMATMRKIPPELEQGARESLNVLLSYQNPMYQRATELIGKVKSGFHDRREDAKNKLLEIMRGSADIMASDDIRKRFYNKGSELIQRVKISFTDSTSSMKQAFENLMANARNVDANKFTEKGRLLRDELVKGYTDTSNISGKVDNFRTSLKDMFNLNSFYDLGKGIGNELSDGMEDSKSTIQGAADDVTRKMAAPFNQFGSDLYDYMISMGGGIRDIWNSLTISPGKASFSLSSIMKKWSMKGYASGGFPESGEFFMANENGVAEYIGSMNGKAAVANNQEIIQGVSDGVYKALKASGLIGDVKIIANKKGEIVFAPSEEAGRVMSQSVSMYNQTGGRY